MVTTKPIKTALCSFGMSGRVFHAPFLISNPAFQLTAVWERTKNLSATLKPAPKLYRRLDDMLDDEEIELVIVNTPNQTHFDIAGRALRAGKHVIVEKPFTVSVAEGLELKKLSEESGLILSVYHNRRYDSDYRTIRKVLSDGVLGRLAEAEMRFDRYRPEPGHKQHKESPGPGTGNLYDLGSHLIDQAVQLFGMPNALFADIQVLRESSRVDDYFELILYYEKLRVRLHATYIAAFEQPGYVFHGTRGSFVKPKTNIQEDRLSAGVLPLGEDWGVEPSAEHGELTIMQGASRVRSIVPSEPGNYMDYFTGIHESIRYGAPAPVSVADALRVIHLIELAYQSSHSRCAVSVNDLFKRE